MLTALYESPVRSSLHLLVMTWRCWVQAASRPSGRKGSPLTQPTPIGAQGSQDLPRVQVGGSF